MEIVIPDMGHGNCIGLFNDGSSSLLIDCGTSNGNKVCNFTNLIQNQIKNAHSRDLIITHYHFDHYSLLGHLPSKFFENIYLPALPKKSSTAEAMLRFLALVITLQFQRYHHLTPIIRSRGKGISCLVKDESFNAIGRDWEVLWPDYQIIDKINGRRIKSILNKIEGLKEKLSDEKSQEFEKWYDYLSKSFAKPSDSGNFPEEIPKNSEPDNEVKNALVSIEKIFKDIANRASLVVRDDVFDFLFTGDIDNVILENYLDFGNHSYFLIEAPHHGGYYGCAFDNLSTEVLVISRNANNIPNCKFFRNLPWNVLVDTPRTGNCIVRWKGRKQWPIVFLNRNVLVYFP